MIKFIEDRHVNPIINHGDGFITEALFVRTGQSPEHKIYDVGNETKIDISSIYIFAGVGSGSPYYTAFYVASYKLESPIQNICIDNISEMLEDFEDRWNKMLSSQELADHVISGFALSPLMSGVKESDPFALSILKALKSYP